MDLKHSPELVRQAQQLYCVNGLSAGRVAAQLGLSERTVRHWIAKRGWETKRDEVQEAFCTLGIDTILLRAKLLEKCLTSLNPQDAFALVALESAAMKRGAAAVGDCPDPSPGCLHEIFTLENGMAALNAALRRRLNRILADPAELDFPEMRYLLKVLELAREMESRLDKLHGKMVRRPAYLPREAAEQICEQSPGPGDEGEQPLAGRNSLGE